MSIKDLLAENNINKKVLLYAREPVGAGILFRNYGDIMIRKYLRVENYDILSDYPLKTDYFLDLNKYNLEDISLQEYALISKVLKIDEIIKNERVFRIDLSYLESLNYILVCAKFIIDFFKKHNYDILVTNMVDSYILDILTRFAKHYNVKVISFCDSFFSQGHMFITERGELNEVREVSDKEASDFVTYLKTKNSNPFALKKNTVYKNVAKSYITYKAKYLFHFIYKHKIIGKKEYRYIMAPVETYARNLSNIFFIKNKFIQSLNDISHLDKTKNVYIPLHYHPESTTEYWVRNPNYMTYFPSLFSVIKDYADRGFNVLVKEHPAAYMKRDKKLYDSILSIPNTYLISPFITTHELFAVCEYTAIWTGTAGIEAIMSDKKVILTQTETYFSFGKIPYIGDEVNAKIYSEPEKIELARNILSGLLAT